MTKQTYTIIGSDGTPETYPAPYDIVTDNDVERATALEQEIVEVKQHINLSFLALAVKLDEFERDKLYLAAGADSMELWCESPAIDIKWRTAQDLIRIARQVLPLYERYPELPSLSELGVSKARALLPLLRLPNGEEQFVSKAIQVVDADWTWKDTVAEVKNARGVDLDPSKPLPIVFMAKVKIGESTTRVKVTGSDGNRLKDCGSLVIPNEWWPRWEERFGRFVEFEDEG